MNARFRAFVDALPPLTDRLLAMDPVTVGTLPSGMPTHGVYLLSEGTTHLYVGRSNKMRERLRAHRSGDERKAAFAFILARETTGRLKASYKKKDSRPELMKDPAFVSAFEAAKKRISLMDARFVEADDSLIQCLLEIYVAVTLDSRYNNFDNH